MARAQVRDRAFEYGDPRVAVRASRGLLSVTLGDAGEKVAELASAARATGQLIGVSRRGRRCAAARGGGVNSSASISPRANRSASTASAWSAGVELTRFG
ncbi:MAG: hypothetical protein ACR2NR_11045 [Solirubrobacteraceae bacterium]